MPTRTTVDKNVDKNTVTVGKPNELNYWTKFVQCSEAELRDALEKVGPELSAVQRYVVSRRDILAKHGDAAL